MNFEREAHECVVLDKESIYIFIKPFSSLAFQYKIEGKGDILIELTLEDGTPVKDCIYYARWRKSTHALQPSKENSGYRVFARGNILPATYMKVTLINEKIGEPSTFWFLYFAYNE